MVRTAIGVMLAGLMLSSAASAQTTAWRFRWQPRQVLTYRVEQVTTASDTSADNTVETNSKLNLVKRWQVQAVDSAGVATLQLSLAALRLETTAPKGDLLLFDSANPDKSDPQMREHMARYVGQPLAVLRIDSKGKVVEVKESKYGPASRYENELPFVLMLPDNSPQANQSWERAYKLTLDPPQGTGDKYDAVQKYTCKAIGAGTATITLTTTLKTMPESQLDRVPLLQLQPEGTIVFDTKEGLLRSANLRIDKELKGHQGEGSSYRFQSTYTEEYVGKR